MNGFLGTGGSDANLISDLNLLAYVVLIVPAILVGFVFARRKMFRPYHKITMTTITLVNWVIIVFLMAVRYSNWVAPYLQYGVNEPARLLPSIHLVTGALAQILATYLVILMWTERTRFAFILPNALRITNIKIFMRLTLTLWLVTAGLGILTYLTWYPPAATAEESNVPISTEEPEITPEATAIIIPEATPEISETVEPAATTEVVETSEAAMTPEPAETEEMPAETPDPS